MTMLNEAGQAGSRLGGDHNHRWTAFGPVNVLLHRISVAVRLGDAGSAIKNARRVNLDQLTVTERKASFFVDTAQAFSQWGKHLYELGVGVVWPTSMRWPSGSRMYARISRPWSLGSVRNSAPLADQTLDAVAMSVTRMLRKALTWSGSGGVVRVTVGLSSVGPPPSLRMSRAFATSRMTGSRSRTTFPPNTDW